MAMIGAFHALPRIMSIEIVTTTAVLARAMFEGWTIADWNAGCYQGTTIPLRKLTGHEIVTIRGRVTGAVVVTDETWISDRFGSLGATQIRRLQALLGCAP